MEADVVLLAISVAIFIGFISNMLFRRYKAPDVLILILLGFVFGPGVLGVVDQGSATSISGWTPYVSGLAIAIIMFDAGLDLSIKEVIKAFPKATMYSIIVFLLTSFGTALISMVLTGISFEAGLLLGFIIGGISAALVVQLISQLRISSKIRTTMTLEAAITDVLMIVLTMAMIIIIRTGDANASTLAYDLISTFLFSALIGIGIGLVWSRILHMLVRQPYSYMITLGAALAIYAGTELMLNHQGGGAMAAMMFGLTLANQGSFERRLSLKPSSFSIEDEIKGFHGQVSFFIRTFFFVYLGIVISTISMTLNDVVLAIGVFLGLAVIRYMSVNILERRQLTRRADRTAFFMIIPRGLTTAVLATVPLSVGVVDGETGGLILGTATLIILMTSAYACLGAYYVDRISDEGNGTGTVDDNIASKDALE